MGWGTAFKAEIYLSRETFKSMEELEYKISNTEEEITSIRTQIQMYMACDPKSVNNSDDSIRDMYYTGEELLDSLQEHYILRDYLYMLKGEVENGNVVLGTDGE